MDNRIQLFKDSKVKPTNELIAKGLGLSYDSYINLIEKMKQESIILMNWRYYSDGKVWLSKGEYNWKTSRGNNKVKPIFWISIWKDFFRISFFFSEESRNNLLSLPISDETGDKIKNTNITGKVNKYISLIFDISDNNKLNDLLILAQYRKENI